MAVTWDIVSLDSIKTVGSLSDVVTTVHWTAIDKDGDHSGNAYGSVDLAKADSSSFTAYKDITKNNAIAWVKAVLGSDQVTSIEKRITDQISESKNPTITSGTPW